MILLCPFQLRKIYNSVVPMPKGLSLKESNFQKQMLLLSLLFRAGSHCGTLSNSLVSLLYIIAPKCLQFHLLSLFKKHRELGPPGKYALGAQVKSNTLANCLYSGHNVEPLDCQKERLRLNEDKDVMSPFSLSFLSPVTITLPSFRAIVALSRSIEYEKTSIPFRIQGC